MTKTSEVKKRLRENQRACRVRQKELIEDLRRRVRELEDRGIQATKEMQCTARAVEWENNRLRALLSSHGISTGEIDNFLRPETKSHLAWDQGTAAESTEPHVMAPQNVGQVFAGDFTDLGELQAESSITLAREPATMVTLCDKAAKIVAEAHGHRDTEVALNALGCARKTKDCVVNNVKIFDIIGQTL
ncbi:hypothetical protein CMQ_4243 [Grosmannia clavigera kw1407]|uniref:Bzip transcription factor n=1 Tax=Grosmannia clavigera (strain kw1407 / UAMH 11150) TaxID=655863 RepID=F0XAP4_GROCL|nr:uncharacterized protein CMQ_4243 [Grosmannia clavigera kw1407]EFX06174.1 hypothetical protein CMQ_4243 [Grosmannia clavigera kw1407]